MQIHDVKRNHSLKKTRQIGRGGRRGKTSGRGHKGQKARAGAKLRPEARDVIKKIPKRRGRGKNSFTSIQTKPAVINLSSLSDSFSEGEKVTPEVLAEKGLVKNNRGNIPEVKVLGGGDIDMKISVKGCTVSESAKQKIAQAGGAVE